VDHLAFPKYQCYESGSAWILPSTNKKEEEKNLGFYNFVQVSRKKLKQRAWSGSVIRLVWLKVRIWIGIKVKEKVGYGSTSRWADPQHCLYREGKGSVVKMTDTGAPFFCRRVPTARTGTIQACKKDGDSIFFPITPYWYQHWGTSTGTIWACKKDIEKAFYPLIPYQNQYDMSS
jgi:hypothetical protein